MTTASKKKNRVSSTKTKLKTRNRNKTQLDFKTILYKNLQCDNITKLMNTIKVIKFLGEGSTGHSLKLCSTNNCEYPVSVKFSKVSKSFTFNSKHPVKVEMKVQSIVNKLIEKNITPHFNQTYGESIICPSKDLEKIKHFNKHFKDFKSGKVKKNIFDGVNKVVVSFMELGESDLFEYLIKNSENITLDEMKGIIFQLYYTLMCIQYYEPGFKHLDLKTDNILVFFPDKNKSKGKFNKYVVGNREFYLPADMVQIKIFDFDFAVSDRIENSKINCDVFGKIGLSREHNPVQDVHYTINFLLNFRSEYFKYKSNVLAFLNSLVPKTLQGKEGTGESPIVKYRLSSYYIKNSKTCNYKPKKGEILSPAEALIESNLFSNFQQKNVDVDKVSQIFDSAVNVENIKKRSDMYLF